MSRVVARASAEVQASPERVVEFLRDYRESRERILTDNYTAYRVEQGGKGEGTVFAYHFAAGGRATTAFTCTRARVGCRRQTRCRHS
jgi:hypothetical protein